MGYVPLVPTLYLQDAGQRQALVVAAMRCWRDARDRGEPATPRLHGLLSAAGAAMAALCVESLLRSFENYLGRSFTVGAYQTLSDDEWGLLKLLGGGHLQGSSALRPDSTSQMNVILETALRSVSEMFSVAGTAH